MAPDLAWNTAVSFLTNTNWQFYSGEQAMSYLSQMAGLAWHNFVSAAVGIAVAVAVVRGLVRTSVKTLGNFWVDLTRCSLYVLLPIAVVFGLFFVSQGMPQNFHAYATVHSIEGFTQSITGGPMASQEVIKEAGTNGGGFVNANSASPNENPSPLTNLVEMLLIFALGAGLTYMYGRMVKDTRQGWAIFTAMAILFFVGFTVAYWAEAAGNPIVHQLGIAGGNMEGKECRFGTAASALFATVTTDTSCGAVNAMHDSFMPLGGLVPLVDMQLGEIVFGGVGSGLYGMIVFVVLTVFIAGLMVGRTPEYLGKKIERREVQFAILAALVTPVLCLVPTAIAAVLPAGLATLNNAGPHGFSEILYAFTSTNANNGSAFAGLGPNLFYNLLTGVNMMFGRFAVAIPALALAGALAGKKAIPEGPGTFTTHSRHLRRSAHRRDRDRRRADLSSGRLARAGRRAPPRTTREDLLMLSQRRLERRPKALSLFDRAILTRALADSFRKLDPRWQARNPVMFVVEVGAAATTIFFVRDLAAHASTVGFDFAICGVALVHGALCKLRRSRCRGARQGPGRGAAPHQIRHLRAPLEGRRDRGAGREHRAAQGGPRTPSKPATSFPPTATCSRVRRRSTSPPLPANRRRSFASRAATAAPSPAERACSPIVSSFV